MLIDMHVHTFPDKIAARAIEKLAGNSGYFNETDGTMAETLKKMEQWGIDLSVVLNIATKPSQHENVNNYAKEITGGKIIGFGSVYPTDSSAAEEIDRINALGLKGIKLHPDYQNYFVDDPTAFDVYEKCERYGIIISFHSGRDIFSPDVIHNTPERLVKVMDRFPDLKIIAAHFGGEDVWDDVEKYFTGRNIYLDTSFAGGRIDPAQAKRIIRNHGAERILFGTDCPWQSGTDAYNFIESLELTHEEKEKIYYKNALELLGG